MKRQEIEFAFAPLLLLAAGSTASPAIVPSAQAMRTEASRGVAPASGFVHIVRYRVDKAGRVVQPERHERLWFKGRDVRREIYSGGKIEQISVTGAGFWTAYPRTRRIQVKQFSPNWWAAKTSYPDQVGQEKASPPRDAPPRERSIVKGWPCWKYSWHKPAERRGHMLSPAENVSYWFYANERFPLTLRYDSSTGVRERVLELKLNSPVASRMFQKPANFTSILPFKLPAKRFLIEIQEKRVYVKNHHIVLSREVWAGDGQRVTLTRYSERNATPSQPPERFSYDNAKMNLEMVLRPPLRQTAKRLGRQTLLGLPVEVYEQNTQEIITPTTPPNETTWMADHPTFGTIPVRHIERYAETLATWQITRLEG